MLSPSFVVLFCAEGGGLKEIEWCTIRPSASLISEKSADFSAFIPAICQIFRKSDRKVIENKVLSALKNFLLLIELTFKRSRDIISLSKSKPFLQNRKKMIDKSLVKLL